jgi:hypothetical protein
VQRARIQRQRETRRAVAGQPAGHRFRFANGEAAQYHTRDACIEQALHIRLVAYAAAGLDMHAIASNRLDHCEVLQASASRTIEIDQMQPLRTRLRVTARLHARVNVIGGLLGVVALLETHHTAGAQIDGR